MPHKTLHEHPFNHSGQLILFVVFILTWVLDSFFFHYSTMYAKYIPIWSQMIIFVTTFLVVFFLFRSVLIAFTERKQSNALIISGIFRYLRHPMYFACIIFYVGLSFGTMSLLSLFLVIPIFIFYNWIAAYEENYLTEKYGEEYTTYKNNTYRWRPKI